MGTSNWQNISYCVGLLRRVKPASFLDIGAGFGRWGVLAREFLDVWEGRESRDRWQVRIEGIEVFPGCLTAVHDHVYDRIHVGDALEVLPGLGSYDVVYMGDVVEHQDKPRGVELINLARRHANEAVILTIPIGDAWNQGMGADGNAHHPHRSVWALEDFDHQPAASRRVFSDYLGRPFVVIELQGRDAEHANAEPPANAVEPARTAAWPLDPQLLARIDECFDTLRVLDNPDVHIDAGGALLWQTPSARSVEASLTDLASAGAPAAAELRAMADALFRHFVATEAQRWREDGRQQIPPTLAAALDATAAALSRLAARSGTGTAPGGTAR